MKRLFWILSGLSLVLGACGPTTKQNRTVSEQKATLDAIAEDGSEKEESNAVIDHQGPMVGAGKIFLIQPNEAALGENPLLAQDGAWFHVVLTPKRSRCQNEGFMVSEPYKADALFEIELDEVCDYHINTVVSQEEEYQAPEPQDDISFDADIAPLMAKHCISCHADSSLTTDSLETYKAAFVRRNAIKNHVKAGTMPPQEPMYPSDIAMFQQWVERGAQEEAQGSSADREAPSAFESRRIEISKESLNAAEPTSFEPSFEYRLMGGSPD